MILTTSVPIGQFVAGNEIDGNARCSQCDMWTLTLLRPTLKAILGARIAKQDQGRREIRDWIGLRADL